MIEVKIECLNPGCKINYKLESFKIDANENSFEKKLGEVLKLATDEVIRIMNNRELEHNKKKYKDNLDLGGLTINTSDNFTTEL